jgi:hypothetical protein
MCFHKYYENAICNTLYTEIAFRLLGIASYIAIFTETCLVVLPNLPAEGIIHTYTHTENKTQVK